jgi:hypothetical protein
METIPDYIPALRAMAVEQAENATEHDFSTPGGKGRTPWILTFDHEEMKLNYR